MSKYTFYVLYFRILFTTFLNRRETIALFFKQNIYFSLCFNMGILKTKAQSTRGVIFQALYRVTKVFANREKTIYLSIP